MKEWWEGNIGEKGINEGRCERNASLLNFNRPSLLAYIQNFKY
jgi:hypothetical protein